MNKKKRLGRGLDALILGNKEKKAQTDHAKSEAEHSVESVSVPSMEQATYPKLSIERLCPNPNQPRKHFEEEPLEDLAASIARYGIIQPIVVRENTQTAGDADYEIIAGERRYRAAKKAGLKEVPVLIRKEKDSDSRFLSIVENVQRADLNPLEEALAYQQMMQENHLTQKDVAEALGKSRSYIANLVRLLQLDEESLEALKQGLLTSSQARVLLAEENIEKRAELRRLLLTGALNVNAAEKKISDKKQKTAARDPYVVDLEQRFMENLGTKVNIAKKKKGWSVSVICYSDEDLQRLAELLGGEQ